MSSDSACTQVNESVAISVDGGVDSSAREVDMSVAAAAKSTAAAPVSSSTTAPLFEMVSFLFFRLDDQTRNAPSGGGTLSFRMREMERERAYEAQRRLSGKEKER